MLDNCEQLSYFVIMAFRHVFLKPIARGFSCGYRQMSSGSCELLRNRTVLSVERTSCRDFLQGLITNDINLLSSQNCIYTMLLNPKGRVLFDGFLYKSDSPDKILIECCSEVADSVMNHLKIHSLRKKIDISKSPISVWAVFADSVDNGDCIPDPRCSDHWVYRCLTDSPPIDNVKEGIYDKHRIALGIAEGSREIPVAEALPLEYNVDFLNGVSFDKGCYIGQELTARTHHTGVIRKRIMPLELNDEVGDDCDLSEPVVDIETSKAIGKIRGVHKNRAVALMRVKETVSSKGLSWGNCKLRAVIPSWWPSLMKETSIQ